MIGESKIERVKRVRGIERGRRILKWRGGRWERREMEEVVCEREMKEKEEIYIACVREIVDRNVDMVSSDKISEDVIGVWKEND